MTPSPITQIKGGIEVSVGSPIKKPLVNPKKSKRNETFHDPSEGLLVHVDLHFSK
jgi:hypothetical protein